MLPLKSWGGAYPQRCSTGCSVQGGPLTPFPSSSAHFPCLGCKSLSTVLSLFSAMSVFCPTAHPDAHCPSGLPSSPMEGHKLSPSQLPLRTTISPSNPQKQVRFYPQRLLGSNNPSPKSSPGEMTSLLPCLLPVQMLPCVLPHEMRLETLGIGWLYLLPTPLALPTEEQLDSCCPSWDGKEVAQQDPISQIYYFLGSYRRPARITASKFFLLEHRQYSWKQEKHCQVCKMNIQKQISISTLRYRIITGSFLLREWLFTA